VSRRLSLALRAALLAALALAPDAFADATLGRAPGAERSSAPPAAESAGGDISPAEQLARAKAFVAGIEEASRSIQRELQMARRDRDVVRVLCLNDKLNQVDVALGSAQDRFGSLRAAVEQSDGERVRHEFTVLEVLNDRARALSSESSQCMGEETGFVGEAQVSVSIDPNLPNPSTENASAPSTPPPPPDIVSPIE
jgi:hypothetical protein